jgi:hypothetical protein
MQCELRCLFFLSFSLLAYINCTKYLHCDISIHAYKYLDKIHPIILPPPLKQFEWVSLFYIHAHVYGTLIIFTSHLHPLRSPPCSLWFPPPIVLVLHWCHSFPFSSRFHVWERMCDICLSQSGLFRLIWWFPFSLFFCNVIISFFFMAE